MSKFQRCFDYDYWRLVNVALGLEDWRNRINTATQQVSRALFNPNQQLEDGPMQQDSFLESLWKGSGGGGRSNLRIILNSLRSAWNSLRSGVCPKVRNIPSFWENVSKGLTSWWVSSYLRTMLYKEGDSTEACALGLGLDPPRGLRLSRKNECEWILQLGWPYEWNLESRVGIVFCIDRWDLAI